jgi:hypothetical protein
MKGNLEGLSAEIIEKCRLRHDANTRKTAIATEIYLSGDYDKVMKGNLQGFPTERIEQCRSRHETSTRNLAKGPIALSKYMWLKRIDGEKIELVDGTSRHEVKVNFLGAAELMKCAISGISVQWNGNMGKLRKILMKFIKCGVELMSGWLDCLEC